MEQKFGSSIIQEKKITELLDKEKSLEDEVIKLKEEKDKVILEYHR